MTTEINVRTAPDHSFEDVCWALAEGEHDLGDDATDAGQALLQWPGPDWCAPAPVDTRPRVPYVTPAGVEFMHIQDHGDLVPATVTLQERGDRIVTCRLSPSYAGPARHPL